VRDVTPHELTNEDILALVWLVFKHGKDVIFAVLKNKQAYDSISDVLACLEDILAEKKDH